MSVWYRDQLQKQVDWQSKDLTEKMKELYSTRQEQVCVSMVQRSASEAGGLAE